MYWVRVISLASLCISAARLTCGVTCRARWCLGVYTCTPVTPSHILTTVYLSNSFKRRLTKAFQWNYNLFFPWNIHAGPRAALFPLQVAYKWDVMIYLMKGDELQWEISFNHSHWEGSTDCVTFLSEEEKCHAPIGCAPTHKLTCQWSEPSFQSSSILFWMW